MTQLLYVIAGASVKLISSLVQMYETIIWLIENMHIN